MRGFRDRDFIQTREGFFFCVVGAVHPTDRVISYIKYVPSQSGIWGHGEEKFSRILQKYTIPNLLETFNYLEQNYPHYLFYSPADNITITAVPHKKIKEHFKPEHKLDQLRQAPQLDSLQKKLVKFTQFLEQTSGVSAKRLGVTGSLLLDIHNPKFSDIDITVYGVKSSWELKDALTKIGADAPVKRLAGKALDDWCNKKAQYYPMTPKEALKLYERKWNLWLFEDTWVSIHPIKLESEVTEKYGQKMYSPCGQVTIRAVVSNNIDSLFLPAVYQIKDVQILEGTTQGIITEAVSYETLYDSLAENGETIQVKGKLEKVIEKETRQHHYRVLVGSAEGKGNEYIKLVE
ncbi:MAG: hypothetical protein CW691_11625 [Candidatus Bathyarchaeum sp.]|nr:MAG: hypothetical protein CW691_11625 [Candidatus Bathyarchaeum sp.]